MSNIKEFSNLDSSPISSHFFSDSPAYATFKKRQSKPNRFFYYLSTPRKTRKAFERQADIEQQLQVAKCWAQFANLYFDDKLPKYSLQPKKSLGTEKIIWQYWGQGIDSPDLPETVRLCFKSVDNHSGDYTVIRLDNNNIHDYLDLPDFVWQKKTNPQFKHAFFADLLRLALLDVYGGVWLDATIYLSSPLAELSNLSEHDSFFMYQRDVTKTDREEWIALNKAYFSWDENHKINVLNSIIYGQKNSQVIHTCLDMLLNFWRTQEHIPHYFFFQIMFDHLINNQLATYQCKIIDDTEPHLLVKVLDEPFDKDDYDKIIGQVNTHKLRYKKQSQAHSYYQYLLDNT